VAGPNENLWRWTRTSWQGYGYASSRHLLDRPDDTPPGLLGPDGKPLAAPEPPPLAFGFQPPADR
jgi:hypothetical protein